MNKHILGITMTALVVTALTACSMPRLHRVMVQQGNVVTQEMIDKLEPGMTREQVAFVMGEPVMRNTFDDDRWDFIYTLEIPGSVRQTANMTLYFESEVLAYFTGDLAPSEWYPNQGGQTDGAEGDESTN